MTKTFTNYNSIYSEKSLWFFGYLLVATSFIFIAQDNSLYQLMRLPSFYSDLAFAFATTFLVFSYLKWLNTKLNDKQAAEAGLKARIKKQVLFGILSPAILAMALEMTYLTLIGISVFDSSIFNLELPLILSFLVTINLLYFVKHLLQQKKEEVFVYNMEEEKSTAPKIESISVQLGSREEQISIEECAYIFSNSKLLWLQTFSGNRYRIQGTLEDWEQTLKEVNFYRINRQFLSALKAIKSVDQTETRRLKVNFAIPSDSEVYISKTNISTFRDWWKRASPS